MLFMGIIDWLQARLKTGGAPPAAADEPAGPLRLYRAGQAEEAERQAQERLAADPQDHEGLLVRGWLEYDRGQLGAATRTFEQVVQLRPDAVEGWSALGRMHIAANRRDPAQAALQRAHELQPNHAATLAELAILSVASGDLAQAEQFLARLQRGDARAAEAHYQLGNGWLGKGQADAALRHLQRAVALDASHAEAHANLGALLRDLGRTAEAATALQQALRLKPALAAAAYNLAMLRINEREWAQAVALLRQYLAIVPRDAGALYWLGNAAMGTGDAAEARKAYQAAIRIDGKHVQARWGLAMAQLPAIAMTPAEQDEAVQAFRRELDQLDDWFRAHHPADAYLAVGAQQPYYLAYIEQNHQALLAQYGSLCTSLMSAWARKVGVPAPATGPGSGKLKVGIVSAHIHHHSVWHALLRGWIEHLDARQFELHVFHTGALRDDETRWAAKHVTQLHQGIGEWTAWAKLISDGRFDVLIYPEIGMDATTVRLASLRLARTQFAGWGHPITTGLPTIDGYLSAQAFEPGQAQSHYGERLIALPQLGCAYRPYGTAPEPVHLSAWGVLPGDRVLLCAGQPFKYAPRDDALLVEVARRCQPCKLLFFRSPGDARADLLEQRLRTVFGAAGLDFEACVRFVPWQSQAGFFGLLQQAHVYLDSAGFSGFNTAMQAIECATPVVAWEGRHMRGRFASGILRQLQLDEWVTNSVDDYAERVARLCADEGLRAQVRRQITERRGRLYDDRSSVDALAQQLLAWSGRA
jgi:protein O-GlcNAc transferase